ncbi:MAG: SDR family NAD(P)-dependent oxidoreductase, partial [Maribacter dokdonensis]
LAENINKVYGTNLIYNSVTIDSYAADRKAALGDFMGTVIAGIYEGIKNGANDVHSDYEKAAGREHISNLEMIKNFNLGN